MKADAEYLPRMGIAWKDGSHDKKIRKLSLKEMEPIAREATRSALKNYVWEKEKMKNLTLGSGFEGDFGIFELYLAGKRPEDAVVLTETLVNRLTGEVSVKVFLPKKPEAGNPPA
nr:hypothetical protein [uncultured Ottowia sp.]